MQTPPVAVSTLAPPPQEVVDTHTACDRLRNHTTRVSRHYNASKYAANMLAATTHNNIVDKETLCTFNPKSAACQRTFTGTNLSQLRAVRGFTAERQHKSFRSVEEALRNNVERNHQLENAKCQRLSTQALP